MKPLELWMLNYVLNSLWQIPAVFVAAWLGARLARSAGPRIEHRVWVSAMVLETVLPACQFKPADLWAIVRAMLLSSVGVRGGDARIVLGPAMADGSAAFQFTPLLVAIVLTAYTTVCLYFAGRIVWGLAQTARMLRHSCPLAVEGELAASWLRSSRVFKTETASQTVEVAVSSMLSGPVTVGLRRRVLLVPTAFLENVAGGDLDALLAHEFAHMRRRDFAKNLFYGVFSLPVSFHPLLWMTRSRVAESRELVCDAMAAEAVAGRERYARSLLRLASMLANSTPDAGLHALAIFDSNNFERRIMDLKQKRIEMPVPRRIAIMAACGAIALFTCTSVLALRMEVTGTENQNPSPKALKVHVKDVKILHKEPPVYPVEAKTSGNTINGSVQLDVVIGKTGEPENIRVKKSLRDDYDKSALDAVRNWRWEPYLFNGEPVEVITTVTITYSLKK
jgi:TonB family protein